MGKRKRNRNCRRAAGIFLAALLLLPLAGCGNGTADVVLTTGFHRNEVFRLADASCSLAEVKVYLATEQNLYDLHGTDLHKLEMLDRLLQTSQSECQLKRVNN